MFELYFLETLRLYPPLPMLNRQCTKDWKIPNSTSIIEKGTLVFIPALALHRDPKFYPNPDQFIPERFLPETLANKTFCERPYLPFGEGPRICIGLRMGKIQTKVGLVLMLKNYNFFLSGNTLKPIVMCADTFLISPMGGLELKISKR